MTAAESVAITRRMLRSGTATPDRSASRARNTTALLVAGALAAVLAGAGGATLALWSSSVSFAGGPVTAGDLELSRGDGSWRQVTPGVASPASGVLGSARVDVPTMPGDVIEFRIPVHTVLQGENLQAQLSVEARAALASGLADGAIVATYRVERDGQDDTASAAVTDDIPVGTPTTVPGLEGSNPGEGVDWIVVVTARVGGEYRWEQTASVGPPSWSLDDLAISLQQVRPAAAGGGST
ncbi:alternate-type signal peptide domain-containing protein [Microbacterium sp. Yaish 1]|uniref:alternate-type signal peptide domain-containing protein n=1 Tax=Microbacterium sp. Yaish 1 TaxID=2025014 RepID=UPI000B93EA15|nr:alternate-type signal peptide domain-containing protein [Microbacterium sp. Yaish 1]OYC97738.1 hypothetical protein CI089_04170 [Microbacterium sp. Yaish 1]